MIYMVFFVSFWIIIVYFNKLIVGNLIVNNVDNIDIVLI